MKYTHKVRKGGLIGLTYFYFNSKKNKNENCLKMSYEQKGSKGHLNLYPANKKIGSNFFIYFLIKRLMFFKKLIRY